MLTPGDTSPSYSLKSVHSVQPINIVQTQMMNVEYTDNSHNDIRYHKVTAIETRAREYRHIYDMFMSEETRRRLNLH
ncbi:hypothetical protein PCO31110_00989 [Pandoraea communis]|uniref:Uncharacterized protein n=1 Tax=Pandoraea communis TaxID=2508297 RepID=A0A5E4SWS9_9BURK|nr:hypothetical protein PCO31110_00989 [Pandoraea communis]